MKTFKKFIYEKSVSKAQQRFMGMVRAAQKGEMELCNCKCYRWI